MSAVAKAFFKSIGTVFGIGILVGTAIGLIMTSPYIGIGVGILTIMFQFGIGGAINVGREKREGKIFNAEILGMIKNAKEYRTNTDLSCAYCQTINTVPVSLELGNNFACKSCNQPNRVYIQMSTVRVTQTISKPVEKGDIDMGDGTADVRQTTINEGVEIS